MIAPLLLILATQAPAIPKVIVTVEEPEPLTVVAGENAEARVTATIAEGFRIQANPAADRFLIPTTLELAADERVRVGPIEYPPGEPYRLRGADTDLSTYERAVTIRVPVAVAPTSTRVGMRVVLEGRLRYQACNNVVCLRPTSVPVRIPVRIEPTAESAEP